MPRIVLPRSAKQAFISLFSFVPALLAADAARRALRARRGDRAVWVLAAGVHAIPGAYFANGFLRPAARTSPELKVLRAATAIGASAILRYGRRHPVTAALAIGELFAWHAYTRWYSWFGRTPSSALSVGAALGAQVVLVSPQDEGHTRRLAARHGVGFRYLRDEGLEAASRLGIVNPDGTPAGMIGYDSDTVLPTLVVTDAEGRIATPTRPTTTASGQRPTRCWPHCARPASRPRWPAPASHPEGGQTSSGVGSPALSQTTCPSKPSPRACSAERRGSVKWAQPS